MLYRFFTFPAMLLVVVLWSSEGSAQEYDCSSRMIEKSLDRNIRRKFGPTPEQQLQVYAAGGGDIRMTFEKLTVTPLDSSDPNTISCAARVRIWREDTGTTTEQDIRYDILRRGTQTVVHLH